MLKISASFPLQSRASRNLKTNSPKDFYYGLNELEKTFNIEYVDSRSDPKSLTLKFLLIFEFIYNRITRFGIYKTRVLNNKNKYLNSDFVFSFNDNYSINVGLFYKKTKQQKIIGIFHGLSDIEKRVPIFFRTYFNKLVCKALQKLDFCFFLSNNDLKNISKKFNLDKKNLGKFLFGIDHLFWKPKLLRQNIDILCVGSDINRDYELLKFISKDINIKLITSLKINLENYKNIQKLEGNFQRSNISDKKLRDYYNSSKIILVPIKNVFQPSGQSVALQAMACGKTVLMAKTKGLFNNTELKNMKNIVFFKPNNPNSLNKKISLLLGNGKLRENIGKNARQTVIQNFTLHHMADCISQVIKRLSKF